MDPRKEEACTEKIPARDQNLFEHPPVRTKHAFFQQICAIVRVAHFLFEKKRQMSVHTNSFKSKCQTSGLL